MCRSRFDMIANTPCGYNRVSVSVRTIRGWIVVYHSFTWTRKLHTFLLHSRTVVRCTLCPNGNALIRHKDADFKSCTVSTAWQKPDRPSRSAEAQVSSSVDALVYFKMVEDVEQMGGRVLHPPARRESPDRKEIYFENWKRDGA